MQQAVHFSRSFHVKITRVTTIIVGLLGLVCVLLGLFVYAAVETRQSLAALKNLDLTLAEQHASNARPIAYFLSSSTFHQSPDIEAWQTVLTLPATLQPLLHDISQLSQSVSDPSDSFSLDQVLPQISELSQTVTSLQTNLSHSLILKHLVSQDKQLQLIRASATISDLEQFLQSLSHTKQTWLVLLQNSDELRATGGFAGSYALVTLNDGEPEEIVIEDIYDADGQFTGYIDPPPGVKEYTSSNHGLRLPDANWNPDFAETAQTMLQFFALGNKKNIAGVVALNLNVGQSLLETTGPVWLPDYNQSVTAENLHTILREERDQFFPGSIQKKHILSQTFTIVRQKLTTLSPAQQLKVAQLLFSHLQTKDIQAYAIDPDLQAILQKYGLTGGLGVTPQTLTLGQPWCASTPATNCPFNPTLFFLVESNVGINKANQYISRTVKLDATTPQTLVASIHFTNTGPLTTSTLLSQTVTGLSKPKLQIAENGYANYQRILISPRYRLEKVLANGQPISDIAQDTVAAADGTPLTQYGFLTTMVPASQSEVVLTFTTTDPFFHLTSQPLLLLKQSGLPPTAYTVTTLQGEQQFLLQRDTLLTWK